MKIVVEVYLCAFIYSSLFSFSTTKISNLSFNFQYRCRNLLTLLYINVVFFLAGVFCHKLPKFFCNLFVYEYFILCIDAPNLSHEYYNIDTLQNLSLM